MQFKLIPTSKAISAQERKFNISILATALVMTGFSSTSFAKNNVKETIHVSTTPLNSEIIAVAEQVEVIDAQSPEQQTATSALDLLKGQPGVFVSGSGSTYGQSVHMRGYDARGVKITVDNVTQDFNSGLYDATFIDPTLIKKVYVHKGSGSLQHGGGALAGVIAMKTLNAADILKPGQQLGGRISSGINRNDHSYHAGSTLLARTDSFDAMVSYSQRKKQLAEFTGFKANKWDKIDYANLDNNEKIHNWMLKTSWFAHPAYRLTLQSRVYDNYSVSLKQPSTTEKQSTRFQNTPNERYSRQRDLALHQHFSPENKFNWQADWNLYSTDLNLNQTDLVKRTKEHLKYQTEKRNQSTYGSKFSTSLTLPIVGWVNNHIQGGFDYEQQQQKSNKHAISYPPAKLSNSSGWLNNDVTLHHLPVTFSVGTRFTQYSTKRENIGDNKHTNWSSRTAISMTPTHWLNIYSSYSEGYRAPRMAELYNNSTHFIVPYIRLQSDFRPSPDLQPETNKTTEVGFKLSFDDLVFSRDSLQLGSTYFDTKAKNHIALEGLYKPAYGEWFPYQLYYSNIPSASINGFDNFIHYSTSWFNLNLSHNITTGREDGTGYSLSSIRPETFFARLTAPVATTGFHLGWMGEFTAKQPSLAIKNIS